MPASEPEIVEDPYLRLEVHRRDRLVRITRTDVPYPSLDVLQASFSKIQERLDQLDRSGWSMLMDLRSARGRNDEAFEHAVARERQRINHGFRRLAVLVKTEVGRMQVERHAIEDGVSARVFRDEAPAINWLFEWEP